MKTLKTKNNGLIRTGLCSIKRVFVVSAITALMAVAAQAQVTYNPVFSNAWVVTAGNFPDLTNRVDATGTTSRGVGISPVTTNVLFTSTYANTNGGSGHVATLSFASGSNYLVQLSGTNVASGTCIMMNVRVADDGFVYACNRADASPSAFKIYRWKNETDITTNPIVVFSKVINSTPDFAMRLGDHMDVRGSGINTEIVVVGSSGSTANVSTNFLVFRPTDASCTSFTNFSILVPGNTASAVVSANGVTFEGTNNAIYVQDGSNPTKVRRISYNPATMTASCNRTNTTDSDKCRALKYYASTNGVEMLACVQYSTTAAAAQIARVFRLQTSPTAAMPSVLNSNFPAPYTGSQNGNGLAQVDAKNGYFVFGAPGYGLTFFSVDYTTTAPPSVSASSSGSPVIVGYPVTFTATAGGSTPLSYQWYFNTNTLIVGATTNFYTIASFEATNAGVYTLITTNLYGKATNSLTITTLPNGSSALMTNLWSLALGSRDYLANDNSQRGLAYDPVTKVLVLVSTSSTNGVHLLDAATGADVGELDVSGIAGGNRLLNMAGVSDDGNIYVGNLITSASDSFNIYHWTTTNAAIAQAYPPSAGLPGLGRIGDTMAVRGSGNDIEILCSFRSGTNVALFTTTDSGASFTFNQISVTNLPADAVANGFAGLGLAFGPTNSFYAKSAGFQMRQVVYKNIVANVGEGEVINTYPIPNSEAPIGVDNSNGFVAAIGVTENPQNLAVYDLFAPGGPALSNLSDREFFPVNNVNAGGTGSVAVDVNGGRMFALDSNNGIIALTYAGRPFITANGASQQVVAWATSASGLQSTTNLTVPFVDVLGATSPYTNTTDNVKFFRLKK